MEDDGEVVVIPRLQFGRGKGDVDLARLHRRQRRLGVLEEVLVQAVGGGRAAVVFRVALVTDELVLTSLGHPKRPGAHRRSIERIG